MYDRPETGIPGIDRDLDMLFVETAMLQDIASNPEKAQDGSRVYDFSVRWGTLMSGRLKRLEHYYQAGELTEDQERRYRELKRELKGATHEIERLGVTRPTVPLEDGKSADKLRGPEAKKPEVNEGTGEPGVKKGQF